MKVEGEGGKRNGGVDCVLLPCQCSIEEDFVTWKENLWPTVCQRFGIDGLEEGGVIREYQLVVHSDLPEERVFTGEPHKLGTYGNQKP